jgi:hypothetical protein
MGGIDHCPRSDQAKELDIQSETTKTKTWRFGSNGRVLGKLKVLSLNQNTAPNKIEVKIIEVESRTVFTRQFGVDGGDRSKGTKFKKDEKLLLHSMGGIFFYFLLA